MEFQNIIIRMPNWLGDVVMATPVIAELRKRFPEARITAMCQNNVASLLTGNPHIDEIFSFSRPNHFLRKQENRDVIGRLRQGKYDLGILLTNSFSSAWWFWRSGIKRRLGFANEGRTILLTDRVPFPKERGEEHLVVTYKRVLSPLGIGISDTPPELFVTPEERAIVETILQENHVPLEGKLIGINPGAAFGPAKCWLPERFRQVAFKLLENPENTILFFGDEGSKSLVKEITQGMPGRVVNLAGMTKLRELVALIERCDVFLTNDSGPMHIAAAVRTPLLALFGSTSDIATGPYLFGKVIHKHVSCSPCYLRTCPIDFRCMKRIEVDEVVYELKKMLEDSA